MILDGFAGPGGWSEGLRILGLRDIGLELDTAACRTRAAA
jgi:DNA (cytosine-5)-methyltransferase 1